MKNVVSLVFLLNFYLNAIVNGAGLKEEFTWSRIDYLWPRESRSGFGGYRPNRPSNVIPSDNGGFVFPNDDDDVGQNKPTSTSKPSPTTTATSSPEITYIYGKKLKEISCKKKSCIH